MIDRYRGALLGLACGDAVGTTVEFHSPGSFKPVTDMAGGGPFGLKAGQWTGDTSLALCLATSLVERHDLDPLDQLERYVRWWREGYLSSTGRCFDIGGTTHSALSRSQALREPYPGSPDPHAAGNGSLMRRAPAPLFFAADPRQAIERAGVEGTSSACHSAGRSRSGSWLPRLRRWTTP